MKLNLPIVFLILMLPTIVLANPWDDILLDGSISRDELKGKAGLTTVVDEQFVLIKESKDYFYIGVRTDTATIVNGYLRDTKSLKVMHASAALGEAHYHLENNQWLRDREKFQWIYRDSNYWDELHPKGEKTLVGFYKRFGWTASTASQGSYREWEMLISKKTLPDIDNLQLSFSRSLNGKKTLALYPADQKLTGNPQHDLELHQGTLLKSHQF